MEHGFFKVTHPHHPLYGQQFELLAQRQNWGEDRVMFLDENGRLRSLPSGWTSLVSPDPFVVVSRGRALFRVVDLLSLRALLDTLVGERAL